MSQFRKQHCTTKAKAGPFMKQNETAKDGPFYEAKRKSKGWPFL